MHRRGAGRVGAHLPGLRAALRARRRRRARARHVPSLRGPPRRRARVAPRGHGDAAELPAHAHGGRGHRSPAVRVRLLPLPPDRRRRPRGVAGHRRARRLLRAPHGRGQGDRRPGVGPARRPLPARRPGLRRRDHPAHRAVDPFPPRPRRRVRPGHGDRGLRRVRAPLQRVLDRPRDAVAALDRAHRDDLRRPRRPRRLEHLAGLARRDGEQAVVAAAHPRGAVVVLGLPAPRQPRPRDAGRRPALPQGARGRRRRLRPARGLRRPRRRRGRRAQRRALELPLGPREDPAAHGRLALRPGAQRRTTA